MYLLLLYINRPNVSKLVSLHLGSQPTTVLCHMGDFGCGDGGWTPVMKINGNKVPCGIDLLSSIYLLSIKYHAKCYFTKSYIFHDHSLPFIAK